MKSIDMIDKIDGKPVGPRGPNPLDLLDHLSWNVRRVANNLETNNNLAEPIAEVTKAVQGIVENGTNLLLNYYDKTAMDEKVEQCLNDAKVAASQQAAETVSGATVAMMIPINAKFSELDEGLAAETARATASEALKVDKSAVHAGPDGRRDVMTRFEHTVLDDVLKVDFLSSDVDDEGQQYTKSLEIAAGDGLEITSVWNTVLLEANGLRGEIVKVSTNTVNDILDEELPKKIDDAAIAVGTFGKRAVVTDVRVNSEGDVANFTVSASDVETGDVVTGLDNKVVVGRNVRFSGNSGRTVKLDVDQEISEREAADA